MYKYLEASIKSLLEFNKPTKIYVLAQEDKLPFEIPCKHTVINISGQEYFPAGGPNMGRQNYFTYMSMMRVCVPDLIKADKVIYLDADTIICDSLKPLWEIPLDNKWVAWCPEYLGFWHPYGYPYYNGGVAVYNLKQMREEGFTDMAVFALNTRQYRFVDQDVMNELSKGKCIDIPVRFNECFCCGETDNPAIVHYAGHGNLEDKGMHRREYLEKYL